MFQRAFQQAVRQRSFWWPSPSGGFWNQFPFLSNNMAAEERRTDYISSARAKEKRDAKLAALLAALVDMGAKVEMSLFSSSSPQPVPAAAIAAPAPSPQPDPAAVIAAPVVELLDLPALDWAEEMDQADGAAAAVSKIKISKISFASQDIRYNNRSTLATPSTLATTSTLAAPPSLAPPSTLAVLPSPAVAQPLASRVSPPPGFATNALPTSVTINYNTVVNNNFLPPGFLDPRDGMVRQAAEDRITDIDSDSQVIHTFLRFCPKLF